MEFLLVSSPSLSELTHPFEPVLAEAPLLQASADPLQFFSFEGLFLAANQLSADDICAVGFDGTATDDRKAYNSTAQTAPSHTASVAYLDSAMDKENRSVLRGVFCLLRLNPHTRAFTVAVDPLSSYPVYICGFGETLIVSNNTNLIRAAVSCFGLSLTKSTKALASLLAFGAAVNNRTGFREVAFLPAGKMITGIGPNWRQISAAPITVPEFTSKVDFTRLLTQRLSHNVEASLKAAGTDYELRGHSSRFFHALPSAPSRGTAQLVEEEWLDNASFHSGSSLLPPSEMLANDGVPQLWAVADARIEAGALKTGKASLFWHAPFKNLMAISNSDPIYAAALAARWKGKNREAIAAALALAAPNGAAQRLMKRPFLRDSMNAILDELSKEPAPARPFHEAAHNRQAGLTILAANALTPTFAPFLDPWLSNSFLQREAIGFNGAKITADVLKKLAPKGAKTSAHLPTLEATSQLHAIAGRLAKQLPASAECWTMLDRKKTLRFLASKPGKHTGADLYAGLAQLFLWAAGP